MASRAQTPMAAAARRNAARATPPIQTTSDHDQRYSYMETPVEMQRSTFEPYHQFSSPTNSTIDESPITPLTPNRGLPPYPHGPDLSTSPPLPVEKAQARSPQQMHPAFCAPHIQDPQPQQLPVANGAQSLGPISVKTQDKPSVPAVALVNDTFEPPPKIAVERREPYNPDSLAGEAMFRITSIYHYSSWSSATCHTSQVFFGHTLRTSLMSLLMP
jgi:hypothetical protein